MTHTAENTVNGKLAEAALRQLHLDCRTAQEPSVQFTSRMLHLGPDGLAIEPPVHQAVPVELSPEQWIVCNCRLGQEILRFRAKVLGSTVLALGRGAVSPALVVDCPEAPECIQRRRYYRACLAGRRPVDVTLWPVDPRASGGGHVTAEFHGKVANVSAGGVGVVISDPMLLELTRDHQVWVRFMLPGENESLIFRVEYRHDSLLPDGRQYLVGFEIVESIDPGTHAVMIQRLAHFVAVQQRVAPNRR